MSYDSTETDIYEVPGVVKYKVRRIGKQDEKAVLEFLDLYYYLDEPMVKCINKGKASALEVEYSLSSLYQGHSFMAVKLNEDQEEKIIAVAFSEEQVKECIEDTKKVIQECVDCNDYLGHILKFNLMLDLESKFWETDRDKKCLRIGSIATHSNYRGHKIASVLIQRLMKHAKDHQFHSMKAEASSDYTVRMMLKLGWVSYFKLPFSAYKDKDGNALFSTIPAPHLNYHLVVLRLQN